MLRESRKSLIRLPHRVRYITDLDGVEGLTEGERQRLRPVAERYAFLVNDYYLSLIDWSDPDDPIRQLIIPRAEEMKRWGALDASAEADVTVARGVQHKYTSTVLLLVTELCGAYCRYCFRKRLFMPGSHETYASVSDGLDYIASRPEVKDVLLTGGDPLMLSTDRLVEILEGLREIPHVRVIRIGSKIPAFNPWRILDDQPLLGALRRLSTPEKRIYLVTHFDHPRELTEPALACLDSVIRRGIITINQCPVIRGVNDKAETLAELFWRLAGAGCSPYYLFQVRPTAGNAPYAVPIVRGLKLFEEAVKGLSGLAKRVRFIMSHASGKIEIVGADRDHIYMRYVRAANPANEQRFFVFYRDETACWLEDLEPVHGMEAQVGSI